MSELDELKSLLFGDEKIALDSITQRVERREDRSADVADILPEAIHESHRQGRELAAALKKPVIECLAEAVHDDPQTFGDALYPVMGPAIRRSIMEALRTLAQQINTAIEQSLTPTGLKWRLQAWRAGIPFGEFVLQRTLLYRIEQAYLISRENGLLLAHVHRDSAGIKDSDAVSAMFTAIQDFVKESFSPDRAGRLESADMGDFTLWAVHGPHALLVCVIRGVPPKALRGELSAILERVHFRYGEAIRTYTGDPASVQGVEEELQTCLSFEARQRTEPAGRGIPMPIFIGMSILAAFLVYMLAANWLHWRKAAEFEAALEATPGIYVAGVIPDDGRLVVRGMRDPLALPVESVAATIGLAASDVSPIMQPFQSLAPELVVLRAARQLGQPDGVRFELSGATLVIGGPAPLAWQRRVRDSAVLLSGVDAVEFRFSIDDRKAIVTEFLLPPDGVRVDSNGETIVLDGAASAAWLADAEERLSEELVPWPVDVQGVVVPAGRQLDDEVAAMNGTEFFFIEGVRLVDEEAAEIAGFVERLSAVRAQAAEQGLEVIVELTGYTDGVGDEVVNEVQAKRRTGHIAALVVASGHDAALIIEHQVTADDRGAGVVDPNLRRVSAELSLEAAAGGQ